MHVVTKILVVFCAVLSLLLAALTMSYASNASAIRASYQQLEQDLINAKAAKDDVQSSVQNMQSNHEKEMAKLAGLVSSKEKEVTDLEAKRSELRTQVEQEKAKAEGIANRIAQLAATSDTLSQMNKSYRDEVTKLRDDTLAANRREIELVDRIRDLDGQREVLEQTARALREQLRETQLAMETKASGDGSSTGVFEHTGAAIFARVLEVGKLPSGEDLITISEGSNRDIKPNMLLNITRGDQFIGTMVILTVDPQRSVGKVRLKKSDIQPQDLVLSSLSR
ncbi:MAG: hypothetical protein H7210_08190 [Pyrinomonadaceae bacterium]|nr:hypothetical protein [Phycisphaerales bacterium]